MVVLERISKKDKLWRSIAFSICKDKDVADELVQNMYLRILECNIEDEKATDIFVRVVLYNLFKDMNKKPKYKNEFSYSFNDCYIESKESDKGLVNCYNKLIDTQDHGDYLDCDLHIIDKINKLSLEDRNLLELNYNYSLRELAEIKEISYITVYRNLIRIRKEVLGDRYEKEYKNRRLKHRKLKSK